MIKSLLTCYSIWPIRCPFENKNCNQPSLIVSQLLDTVTPETFFLAANIRRYKEIVSQLLDTVIPDTFFLAANIRREASDQKRTHHGWSFWELSLAGRQGWRVTLEWETTPDRHRREGPGRHTDGLKLDGRGGQQGLLAMQLANQGGSLDQLDRYRPIIYTLHVNLTLISFWRDEAYKHLPCSQLPPQTRV